MGTNYYAFNICPTCNHEEELHLGKSSAGWCFSLHIYPELEINTLEELVQYISNKGYKIKNEYGEEKTINEFLDVVTNRSWPHERKFPDGWYAGWSDFLEENHAEEGPNGLVRHKLENGHCIGHGEGTWDYIIGDFS